MKRTFPFSLFVSLLLCMASWCVSAATGQTGPTPIAAAGNTQSNQPVSYASVTQLNGLLAQLEAGSKNTQADLVKLRIEHWKTDNGSKRQALGEVDSIQRNLQGALTEMIAQLRAAPEDVPSTFKLYRNLDALCSVLGTVVEAAGAFGAKDDLQTLTNDLNTFESTRRQIAERMESLSSAKEAEITRLRAELKAAQAAIPVAPPKKIVIDDNEPPKKAVAKKKAPAKPSITPAPNPAKPAAGQTPPVQAPAKPQ